MIGELTNHLWQSTLFAAAALITSSLSGFPQETSSAWHDPSPHTVQFVNVEDGVRLEVLDWGGSGRPVVLLAGLGMTAHVFDGFAERLTDS